MTHYGLIGKTLGHSFSAEFFNDKFEKEGIEADYRLLEMSSLEALRERTAHLRGFNVTIPYKQQILSLLDCVDPIAARIGAVNTVLRTPDGRLHGFNTDAPAFRASLLPLLPGPSLPTNGAPSPLPLSEPCLPFYGVKPRNSADAPSSLHALILGTGGASRAVQAALQDLGIPFTLVSRTAAPGRLTYESLTPEIIAANRLIINATPLGTFPDVASCPPIPYEALTGDHICHDLVYNPATTEFMRRAASHGATVKNGLEMLHRQALLAWHIWTQK